MKTIYDNHQDTLEKLLLSCREHIILISPFIKKGMSKVICDILAPNIEIEIVANLDLNSIDNGVNDPEALMEIRENFHNTRIYHNENLHAKIYLFDDTFALVTSANLTLSGFESNIEYGVLIENKKGIQTITVDARDIIDRSETIDESFSLDILKDRKTAVKNETENPFQRVNKLIKSTNINTQSLKKNVWKNCDYNEPIYFKLPKVKLFIGDVICFSQKGKDIFGDGKYIIVKEKAYVVKDDFSGYNIIEKTIDLRTKKIKYTKSILSSGDWLKKCFKDKKSGEWVIHDTQFINFSEGDGDPVFENMSGHRYLYRMKKNQGPETIITLKRIGKANQPVDVFEQQLWECFQDVDEYLTSKYSVVPRNYK